VRGNHDREYVFGGRIDAQEEELFSSAGLGLYNPFSTPKSWQAVCAPGEIADFYLDEREVSAAEMLEFVESAEWEDARSWPANEAPSPARRHDLASHLRALDADLPATEVTWVEADAYARWSGKRLQSWVEWEYALRGGTRYRPWAGWSEGSANPRSGIANCDDNGIARGPWPSGRGADVTSDTGIAHLSDNVAEWTSTAVGTEKTNPARLARVGSIALPGARRDLYWVAGGAFDLARFDFSVADRRDKRWHGSDVGFRCALTATEISQPDGDVSRRVKLRAIETTDAGVAKKTGRGGS
jgi:formylglycine-generating enzyme required for sulfatase activity